MFPKIHGLNFANWMLFNVPLMLINVTIAWLWLQVLFMGLFRYRGEAVEGSNTLTLCFSYPTILRVRRRGHNKKKQTREQLAAVEEVIADKYHELGPMTFHEGSVLFLFVSVVVLWFFRAPEFIPGWAEYISDVYVTYRLRGDSSSERENMVHGAALQRYSRERVDLSSPHHRDRT